MTILNRLQRRTDKIFNGWPVIEYQGQNIQKLTTKIFMPNFIKNNTQLFFNYTIKEEDTRPEIVARKYYKDSKLDWVILFFNKIVDPFFEWPLSADQFAQFITDKYTTVANAQSTIYNYQLNSGVDDISPNAYNALNTVQQSYWILNATENGTIIDYRFTTDNLEISPLGYDNLTANEKPYWSAVYYYDYEFNKNHDSRLIKILNPSYIGAFLEQYRKTL